MATIHEQQVDQFKNNMKNGSGKMRFGNGRVQEGMWLNDAFVG